MKFALFIVLSLAALAAAGPATFNRNINNKNEIDTNNKVHQQQHQQQYNTNAYGDLKQTQQVEILKQWCFSSQMSQPELTSSFKKLVGLVKSSPVDEATEAAVMSERICQGALVQKSSQTGETIANQNADAQAHELIKDVYMDAMIACESRECMQQLMKIIQSQKVDTIRASYYMTRMAVAEKDSIKDERDIKQWAENLIKSADYEHTSEAIERQKLFATTSIVGKYMKNKCDRKDQVSSEMKQNVEQVAKIIVERYIRPVSVQDIQQYQQQQQQQNQHQINKELVKKIAKRNAALKALANIPGCVLSEIPEVEQICVELATKKEELNTVRQSAIECLKHNEKVYQQLKQLVFDQEEPIEVRVAALRTIMKVSKEQLATETIEQLIRHCEEQRNQQQDDQFVLYVVSYLDNLRTSQKPEHQVVRECIAKNKQHYMQIQLLLKKFQHQLNDIRRSSRNYKMEQQFNQIESGLILEGDIVYESKQHQSVTILPKLVRVNMSMPIMGETVNVVEITLRQNQMDEQLLSSLKMVKDAKFNSESVSKVVDSFKSSVQSRNINNINNANKQGQKPAEADLTIKVDGCTVVYICSEDFKYTTATATGSNQRNTRSIHRQAGFVSIIEELLEQLKRNPINFNRGFNFNFNERLAKSLDVDANMIAGLRFNSRAQGQLEKDFEIVAQIEPRFNFEAIVGPAKVTSKKLMQRMSTKTAVGLRFRYKNNELVDVQVDLPMNTMELFTFETQLVEKSQSATSYPYAYTYLPESIYGQEDIYSPESMQYARYESRQLLKRSIFERDNKKGLSKLFGGKQGKVAYEMETPEQVARATGLRGKLRLLVSPKDMSFFVQAVCQKHEQQMQGYRFKLEKVSRGVEQQQLLVTVSTPGSRIERTMQLRSIVQANSQRTLIKTDLQSPFLSSRMQLELVHDGRQVAVRAECVDNSANKWRHTFECGVQRSSQTAGRIAATYKPYLTLQSSLLRRPIQLQGLVTYQQQPKTVISWEMKCPTSGDFLQGKLIVDSKEQSMSTKRPGMSFRRSMRSPMEMILERDLTLTGELLAQVEQHQVKVHQMVDFDATKLAVSADLKVSHKNLKKAVEQELVGQLKLNKEQQMLFVQRKCPQIPHREFELKLASDYKMQQQHSLALQYRYNSRRTSGLQSIMSYQHKIEATELSLRKVLAQCQVELIANEYQVDEKIQGRFEGIFERRQKVVRGELSSRDKQAKLSVDFESLEKHLIELLVESKKHQLSHKTSIRADERQFQCQCRTDKRGQMVAKIVIELAKGEKECQVVVEVPRKQVRCVVDLKLAAGKMSSWAIQSGRFASKAEFALEPASGSMRRFLRQPLQLQSYLPIQSLKFKTDLKDLIKQNAYWMDTKYDSENAYFRFDSPIYRTDLEYSPRDSTSKMAMFARSKRSVQNYNQLYSNDESILSQVFDFAHLKGGNKLNLADKMWMVRSMISGKPLREQLKRAIFEYADRQEQHKHQINWSPADQSLSFNLERLPMEEQEQYSRFGGDLSTGHLKSIFNKPSYKQQQKLAETSPMISKLSMESQLVDFDLDFKPFDGEESFAKLNAVSRFPRSSGFKKHESEYKYDKHHGYKASVKHQDKEDRRHQWQLEADAESPKKFAKISMESDKYGKGHYEHNWRKYVNKRSEREEQKKYRFDQEESKFDQAKKYDHQEDVFANQVKFFAESPRQAAQQGQWRHETDFKWEEPMSFGGRVRRSLQLGEVAEDVNRRYNTIDYLRHLSGRVQSEHQLNKQNLYKLDFDYKPQQEQLARLNLEMPNEMLHESSFEYKPTERLFKLQSKLMDQRNKQAHYELSASTKPMISGLASAEQEPLFFNDQQPMLQRQPMDYAKRSLLNHLFRQPMKFDYTDKFGRVARLDYDLVPEQQVFRQPEDMYLNLRQKRAAIYYKDDSQDLEHESSFDFYPETLLAGGFKKSHMTKHNMESKLGDYATKISTKCGPIVVRVEATTKGVDCVVESPLVNAKITGESSSMKRINLYKVQLDNKQQRLQLAKIVRKSPLGAFQPIVKLAHKFDESRFQHQSELLVSIVDAIFKLKSTTFNHERPVMIIDGEFNKQQEKFIVKLDGVRTSGQLVADLVSGTAQLVMKVDDARTFQHQTRLVRLNDKFYTLDSMTSYKQQPLLKLSGKISAEVFSNPMHLFEQSRRHHHHQQQFAGAEHISTFEAVVYEPTMYHIRAQYDCIKKEINLVFKNEEEKKTQVTSIKLDAPNMIVYVDARLTGQNQGPIYQYQSKVALPGVYYPRQCRNQQTCQSEAVYSDKSGVYQAKYLPREFAMLQTPFGKQYVNLAY